ncbi:MAG: hypothetical protein ACI4I1_11125 [Oscillospiraceae bacterium]
MSETIHNWDIEALLQLKQKLQQAHDALSEEKEILTGISFSLLNDWQGKAGYRYFNVTAASAGEINEIINKYAELIQQLESIISQCYEPCENEIRQKIMKLL